MKMTIAKLKEYITDNQRLNLVFRKNTYTFMLQYETTAIYYIPAIVFFTGLHQESKHSTLFQFSFLYFKFTVLANKLIKYDTHMFVSNDKTGYVKMLFQPTKKL
jgi:hypothetical protein